MKVACGVVRPRKLGLVSKAALVAIVLAYGVVPCGYAAPSSGSSSSTSSQTTHPRCDCDAGTHRIERDGKCFLQECLPWKEKKCSMSGVTKTFLNPGVWALTSKEIPCGSPPSQPPEPDKRVVGGGASSAKSTPKETPTPTPKPGCPGPNEENELGIIGDGGAIGQCQDGANEPIPNYPPVEDPIEPDLCYWAFRYCVGGCWFYDQYGVNPVPGECP
jgi:hypothetical protein